MQPNAVRRSCALYKRVREWMEIHSLPVIAMRLIPHVSRRADFPHRAVPRKSPIHGNLPISLNSQDVIHSCASDPSSRHCLAANNRLIMNLRLRR